MLTDSKERLTESEEKKLFAKYSFLYDALDAVRAGKRFNTLRRSRSKTDSYQCLKSLLRRRLRIVEAKYSEH